MATLPTSNPTSMRNVQLRPLPTPEAPNLALIEQAFQNGLLTGDDIVRRATVKPLTDKVERESAKAQLADLEILPAQREQQMRAGELSNQLREVQIQAAQQKAIGEIAAPNSYQAAKGEQMSDAVETVDKLVSNWTTGVGSTLKWLPGTPAADMKAALEYLGSNVAFGELAAMRAASKTGGALGAISERELNLLMSTLGSLSQEQSPASLKANLQKIRDSLDRWKTAEAKLAPGEVTPTGANLKDIDPTTLPVADTDEEIGSLPQGYFRNSQGEIGYTPGPTKAAKTAPAPKPAEAAAVPLDVAAIADFLKVQPGQLYRLPNGETRLREAFSGNIPALPSLR